MYWCNCFWGVSGMNILLELTLVLPELPTLIWTQVLTARKIVTCVLHLQAAFPRAGFGTHGPCILRKHHLPRACSQCLGLQVSRSRNSVRKHSCGPAVPSALTVTFYPARQGVNSVFPFTNKEKIASSTGWKCLLYSLHILPQRERITNIKDLGKNGLFLLFHTPSSLCRVSSSVLWDEQFWSSFPASLW